MKSNKAHKIILSLLLAAAFCFNTVSANGGAPEKQAAPAEAAEDTAVEEVPILKPAAAVSPKKATSTQQSRKAPLPASGNANETVIYEFLTEKMGLTRAAACGVIANIQYESGFAPTKVGDHGTSYGICQWHNGRYTRLRNYCAKNGMSYKTLEGQLNYLKYELETYYTDVLNYLKGIPDTYSGAYNAAYHWCYNFEIPSNRKYKSDERGRLSQNKYWQVYGKDVPVSVSSSSYVIDLHYTEKNSAEVTLTANGSVPKTFEFRASPSSGDIVCGFGEWNGQSVPLRVSMNKNAKDEHDVYVTLIDKATGKTVFSLTIPINTEADLAALAQEQTDFISAMPLENSLADVTPESADANEEDGTKEQGTSSDDAEALPTAQTVDAAVSNRRDEVLPKDGKTPISVSPQKSGRQKIENG